MTATTANMGLTQWDINDFFSHGQLSTNWTAIDAHDHSTGKGVQIGSTGLAPLAIATAHIQDAAVTASKLASNAITGDRIQDGSLAASKLVAGSVGTTQIGQLPQATAYSNSAFSVPNSAATAVSFTTTRLNTPSSIWQVGSPTRLTVPVNGIYYVVGVINWASSAAGTIRRILVRVNGTEIISGGDRSANSNLLWQNASAMVYMSANDYVELLVYQDTGSALNLTVTANSDVPELRLVWLSS